MNSVLADNESGESNSSDHNDDKTFIDKLLGEMKNKFNNKTETMSTINEEYTENVLNPPSSATPPLSENGLNIENNSLENSSNLQENDINDEASDKPRIVLLFKKPNTDQPIKNTNKSDNNNASTNKRALRHNKSNSVDEKNDEQVLKRSARRRSKDCNESVLQSAIARKEKSYNESCKPQRLTRQLKPTQKILENLALAKQDRTNKVDKVKTNRTSDKQKLSDNNDYEELFNKDEKFKNKMSENGIHKRHKHKHNHSKHIKKRRTVSNLVNNEKDSDSDQSIAQENNTNNRNIYEDVNCRRSRRISSSRYKEDLNNTQNLEEQNLEESDNKSFENYSISQKSSSTVGEELIASRLCLCTQKSDLYASVNEEELYCGAVDNIDGKVIGCNRLVDKTRTMMFRPSSRVPYIVLCESHQNRLLRHNCCPTCGIFCSQGRFVECDAKHQYHRNCQISVGDIDCCPHCGLSTPSYDVCLTICTAKKPVILTVQKSQYVSAKMSFETNKNINEELNCVTPPLLPIGCFQLLNNCDNCDEDIIYDINDLLAAIKEDDVEKVAMIISLKIVDLNTKLPEYNDGTVLHLTAQLGLLAIMHILVISGAPLDLFDKEQNTALMTAILSNKNDCVQYLIRTGANIELKGTDGMTPLHLASKCGNLKSCELILNSISNIKMFVNCPDDGGWTPLVWACEHGFINVANYLISKGADPSIRDVEHNVALHWASFSGSSHIVELLLNRGCEVNAINAHGDTPLHIGARQDMYNCIIVLLARGADVTIINKNNESPLDCVPPDGKSFNVISLNFHIKVTVDSKRNNIILNSDISKGREMNPIQCINDIDDELQIINFVYVTKNCLTSDEIRIDRKITSIQYCDCNERCVGDDCYCGKLSMKCWYDQEGKLISDFNFNDIPMIFECNDRCSCNAITCNNRVVQRGIIQRFELFKTESKGWGIRTLRPIPKGSFVCEYVGEIITDIEADKREDDSFLFSLENRVCKSVNDTDSHCIDAKFYGNFARFINHSCNANLTPIKVFIDHQDLCFPRIALFANRDIINNEELCFNYGDKFWMTKYKFFTCCCESPNCKYSEETIEMTLQEYERKH